jgi:hypothetical protein
VVPPEWHQPRLRARWSGALYVPVTATYEVRAQQATRLWLDGRDNALLRSLDNQFFTVLPSQQLSAGWHHFLVEAPLLGPQSGRLLLVAEGQSPVEVASEYLWPQEAGQGLLAASVAKTGPVRVQVDPFIGFTGITPPQAGPAPGPEPALRARWTGELLVTTPGPYLFELRSDGAVGFALDGPAGAAPCARGGALQFNLTAGAHPLQLDFVAQPGQRLLELYWTPPGGERALIPPSALRYAAPGGTALPPVPQPPTISPCAGS